jgi:hypothetical protein
VTNLRILDTFLNE